MTAPVDRIQQLHVFLIARGWKLSPHQSRDDDGCPADAEPAWDFYGSFHGVAMHEVDEVTPARLHCSIDRYDPPGLDIDTAGNFDGCDLHTVREHYVGPVNGEFDLERATVLLAVLESEARALDARTLVLCRFFGPCGESNARLLGTHSAD
uniref:hypothetical protein n=1 Tax=Amycolatopsis sp. CA-096443 TaxID=3239919 RepID=UPI003F499B19